MNQYSNMVIYMSLLFDQCENCNKDDEQVLLLPWSALNKGLYGSRFWDYDMSSRRSVRLCKKQTGTVVASISIHQSAIEFGEVNIGVHQW